MHRPGIATARRRTRTIAVGALALGCLLGGPPPARAVGLPELKVALQAAKAQYRSALAAQERAKQALVDARAAYAAVHDQVNASAAAIWMLDDATAAGADHVLLTQLAHGIDAARAEIGVAEVDVARARRYLDEVRAIVRTEEARAAQRADAQRQQRTSSEDTIACPVEAASAIYADFGAPRPSSPHTGIDIPAPTGTAARAAWYARVVETPIGGWMGKGVILEDGGGNRWLYAHLDSIAVLPGEVLRRGQEIGRVGSTGNSTGPHLHFEIHVRGTKPIDPYGMVSAACGIADPMGPNGRVAHEAATPEAGSS